MNLPNKLTTLRMVAVLAFVIIALFPWNGIQSPDSNDFLKTWITASNDNFKITWVRITLVSIFALGSFTDFLDGYIARKYNLVTTYGKFMDPIADKLLVNSTLIVLAFWNIVPVGCVLIMILRDIFVDSIRMVVISNGKVVAANKFGKAKTVLQMVGLIVVFITPFFTELPIGQIIIYLAAAVSLFSGVIYFIQNKNNIFTKDEAI
jgi:CDP-diacylglycerol--glycerol-3-phosphate 3-phosphatidyltransferase